jgi:hypothetical protein
VIGRAHTQQAVRHGIQRGRQGVHQAPGGEVGQRPTLEASVKVNQPENARLTFDHVANDKIQEMIDTNFKFYKQINDDAEFEEHFLDWLFERYTRRGEKGHI